MWKTLRKRHCSAGAYELAAAAGRTPNATFKAVADGLRVLYCPAEGGADCSGTAVRICFLHHFILK